MTGASQASTLPQQRGYPGPNPGGRTNFEHLSISVTVSRRVSKQRDVTPFRRFRNVLDYSETPNMLLTLRSVFTQPSNDFSTIVYSYLSKEWSGMVMKRFKLATLIWQ
jgi:hypothetical protein